MLHNRNVSFLTNDDFQPICRLTRHRPLQHGLLTTNNGFSLVARRADETINAGCAVQQKSGAVAEGLTPVARADLMMLSKMLTK